MARPTYHRHLKATAGKPNWSLFVECKDKNKNARCTSSKKLLNFEMQVSDLGSPVSPQNLLAEHRQSSPEIDKLIQKTGDLNI